MTLRTLFPTMNPAEDLAEREENAEEEPEEKEINISARLVLTLEQVPTYKTFFPNHQNKKEFSIGINT